MGNQDITVLRFTFALAILSGLAGLSGLLCVVAGAIFAQYWLLVCGMLFGVFSLVFAIKASNGLVLRGRNLGIFGVRISQRSFLMAKVLAGLGAIFGIIALVVGFIAI